MNTSKTAPAFVDPTFRKELSLGKYTRWAENLTEDQLAAVLWAVGEFACRASETDAASSQWNINHPRQIGALKILVKARRVGHGGIGLEAALQMIRDSNKQTEKIDHSDHGRGDAENGPDDPDCPCRNTNFREECAAAGCGFCRAAEPKPATQSPPYAASTSLSQKLASLASPAPTVAPPAPSPAGFTNTRTPEEHVADFVREGAALGTERHRMVAEMFVHYQNRIAYLVNALDPSPVNETVTFTKKEWAVLRLLMQRAADNDREDVCGLILKATGHNLLNDSEIVAMAKKIEDR